MSRQGDVRARRDIVRLSGRMGNPLRGTGTAHRHTPWVILNGVLAFLFLVLLGLLFVYFDWWGGLPIDPSTSQP
jgi:hypothetical protein